MTDLRAKQMAGEQWVLEERTADPASTLEGERWLRTDLNSGDKIATLRVDVGNSIRDVPIFSTGTAVDAVSEAMRVEVNGVTGYIPIAPIGDAAYPEFRMQHNSEIYGYHDSVNLLVPLPDSELDHLWYAPRASSADPWPDEIGSINVSATSGPDLSTSINSTTAMFYDGVDDLHSASTTATTGANQEHTIVAVVQTDDAASNQVVFGNGQTPATDGYRIELSGGGGEWRYISNGIASVGGGSPTTDPTVLTGTYDGSTAILDVNGTEVINASLAEPNAPTTELEIGGDTDGTEPFDGAIGAVGHEAGFADQSRRDELTNSFADAFNITL